MDPQIYDEVVQSIVKSVMLAVNKKLTDYDRKLDSKLSNVKIGSNNLLPGSVNTSIIKPGAVTGGSIADGSISASQVGGLGDFVKIEVEHADISSAQITDLNATVATIADAQIKKADIDFAQINGVAAGTVITAEMIGDKVLIKNLMVTEAMIGELTTGELIVRGEDGGMYAIVVDEDGTIRAEKKYIVNDDIEDLVINAGEKLVKGSILADNIGAEQIQAQHLSAGSITTAALQANCVDAGKIKAGAITTSHLSSEVGKELDISSNSSVTIRVTEEQAQELIKTEIDNTLTVQSNPPSLPVVDMLWLDTSAVPQVIKKWNGTEWEITGLNPDNYYDKERVDSIETLLNANIDILKDQVTTTVSQITQIESALDGKADSSSVEELSTQLKQTAEDFVFIVNKTNELEGGQEAVESILETYQLTFKIDVDGVTIGKSGSDFDMHLDNTQLQFRQKGNVVAYVSNDKLFINRAEILSEMKIGRYIWQKMEDSSLSLMYVR